MIAREFFAADPVTCARGLIGSKLVWGGCEGLVVETEAYDADGDPACHTFFRPAARAFVARHPAGTAYVYLNYGVHWMLNVLTKGERTGFVLIRAVDPRGGLEAMRRRRGVERVTELCSGPGKLTKAFGITGDDHESDLCARAERSFHFEESTPQIAVSGRIGISRALELPWRFFAAGNPHVSRGKGVKQSTGC